MTTPFASFNDFTTASVMPPADVSLVESARPGYILARLTYWTARIMARLRKRYPAGFQQPFPETLQGWVIAIVTPEAYEARGWNPSDAQSQDIIKAAADAWAEVKEAADGDAGLFDLPVSATNDITAITDPAPLAYTETDPYTWQQRQREAYRNGR